MLFALAAVLASFAALVAVLLVPFTLAAMRAGADGEGEGEEYNE